jgi:hypothetical protein
LRQGRLSNATEKKDIYSYVIRVPGKAIAPPAKVLKQIPVEKHETSASGAPQEHDESVKT